MKLLEPKSQDLGVEKHLPVVTRLDPCTLKVAVGSTPHPSTPEHHIVFIALHTKEGLEFKSIPQDGNAPEITFTCKQGDAIGVYSFCNLHGLWFTPVSE